MSNTEKFICGDCKATIEITDQKRGSAFIEKMLWATLILPGFFYSIWRKGKPKRFCEYCGSSFLLPDNYQTHEFLKSTEKPAPKPDNSYPNYPL